MGYQMGYQTGYQMCTLNNVYKTMYLNNVLKQCIKTMIKDNSIDMPMLLSFFSNNREYKATNVAPMLIINNMEVVHARETI